MQNACCGHQIDQVLQTKSTLVFPQEVGEMVGKVKTAAAGVKAELGRAKARAVQAQLQVTGESGGPGAQRVVLRLKVDPYDEVMSATLQASTQPLLVVD